MISAPSTTVEATTTPPLPTTAIELKRNKHHHRNTTIAHRIKSRGITALMYACQQGDVQRVNNIIRTQPSALWIRDRTGKTPLHYSCTSDNICAAQTADLLVMAAPDLIDGRDEDGFTPLHLAVIAGNMPLVTFLLANNADVNAVDHEKHTVVHWATVCGETAALRAVLAAGAPVSTPDVHGGYPLHYAAQMCGGEKDSNLGLQVLQSLLTHSDIVVSVEDGDGRQPLLWAASAGSAKALLALIRAGAAVEAPDKDGLTALHCAASRGHTDCIDTLLTLCGASPDVIDTNGCTALHYAVTLGHADATALLLAHGADPNRQDRKGRSPAHCGCAKGQFETVKMIGSRGANLWLRNARGDLPLHEAAASGRRELVKWLLEMRPSQVNARNNDGRCPLHLAALNDNSDMCKILLDAGAQINPVLRTSKNTFMTPLDCALQRGFRSTAKYLQLHGGVPANRLKDARRGIADNNVNLQIKDDITFWGDTSTDSERENGGVAETTNRKIQRKKLSYKYEKKRASLSGSDVEMPRKSTNRLDSGRNHRKLMEKSKRVKSSATTRSDSMSSSIEKHKARNRFDYTNEIVINGKTEINIHQTKHVTISKDVTDTGSVQNEIVKNEEVVSEKEKRPKSAKHSKVRDKSAKSQKDVISACELEREPNEETTNLRLVKDEVNEAKTDKITVEEKRSLGDQQSIISNTSEDVEEHRRVTVEAAIHEPPKDTKSQLIEETTKIDEKVESTDDAPVKPEESTVDEVKPNEVIESVEKQIEESVKTNEKPKETKDSQVETDPIDFEATTKGKDIETVDSSCQTISEETQETVEAEITEKVAENPENIQEHQEQENIVVTEARKESEPIESQKEDIIEEKSEFETTQEQLEIHEEKDDEKIEDVPLEPTGIQKILTESEVQLIKEEKIEDLGDKGNSEIVDQNKADNSEELNDEPKESEEIAESLQEQKRSPEEGKKSKKVDSKRKKRVTDDKANEDQDLSKPDNATTTDIIKENEIGQSKSDQLEKEKSKKRKSHRKKWDKKKAYEIIESTVGQAEEKSDNEENSSEKYTNSSSTSSSVQEHKSFRILDNNALKTDTRHKNKLKKQRSRSEEGKRESTRKSRIPTPVIKSTKTEKVLDIPGRKTKSSLESRVPSLPNIHENRERIKEHQRSESNMSAPILASVYSDNEHDSGSDMDEDRTVRKRLVKRRSKTRDTHSAGSDYESSHIIDSGFEPSPRSSRIPKWRNITERGVNMTSVTQTIQTNIRRYHLERKIFQHLLELKRLQIRAGQHNEAILVKRAIDAYHQSCASTVGAGRYIPEDYSFKSFEKFLYLALRKLQRNGADYLKGLPETPVNPLLCTKSTNRCMHATHAYTGIPCAAYLHMMDHHSIPKIGFTSTECKPGTGFLPNIKQKKSVTLELCHGTDKQIISLPADRLDQNKRYYVTFTVKGNEDKSQDDQTGHTHPKSD